MRKAGCIKLAYGIESASPRMLEYIDKRITQEQASKIIRETHEAGIWVGLNLITGMPTEKEEDIEATINFLKEHNKYINEFSPSHFSLGREQQASS